MNPSQSTCTQNESSSPPSSSQLSKKKQLQLSSRELSEALMDDLPLLMYGSGDVYPFPSSTPSSSSPSSPRSPSGINAKQQEIRTDVNTTSLLAELTASFINDLVNAAVDSHDIFTDGKSGGGGGIILPHSSLSQTKRVLVDHNSLFPTSNIKHKQGQSDNYKKAGGTKRSFHSLESSKSVLSMKNDQRSVCAGNWEEELPMPIILSEIEKQPRHADENWRGAVGLDLKSNQIRSKYMTSTTTINEKSFLFPIYHDSEMFNRSKEILSFHDGALDAIFDQGIKQCLFDVEQKEGCLSVEGSGVSGDAVEREERRKRQRKDALFGTDEIPMPLVWPGFSTLLRTQSSASTS